MRRYALRLITALLTFALGVLLVTLWSDLRLREALWTIYGRVVPKADKVERIEGCYSNWPNVATSKHVLVTT
jgi:hypothetical protein